MYITASIFFFYYTDINECKETPGVCSQICMNTEGNYTCKCNDGYQKTFSGRCKRTDSMCFLLYYNSGPFRENPVIGISDQPEANQSDRLERLAGILKYRVQQVMSFYVTKRK